jgi:hypothetical protein
MKRPILPLLGLLCTLSITATGANGPAAPAPAPGKLIVHEWGTFTGFAGSDGVHVPFRSSVGGDLPGFVFTRPEQALRHSPDRAAGWLDLGNKDGTLALQRMETPVVYFYADAPREVEAWVEFPQGQLTEFYPPVRAMTPQYGAGDANKLQGASLDWGRIRLDPGAGSARFPKADPASPQEAKNHYFQARATDAATVQFSDRPNEVHEENFLFYRGLGNFTLPVTVAAGGNDRFFLRNAGPEPIAAAFLVRISGGKVRFSTYRNISPQRQQEMRLPPAESAEDLGEAVVKALVAEGLYEKEARAMVKTWESSWFGEEGTGTRVLYTLPRRTTDELLPLKISPTPDETVRVLVGRIDVLTPEQEDKIAGLIKGLEAGVKISREDARELKPMGRFLTPALERAADRMAKTQAYKLRSAVYSAAQ